MELNIESRFISNLVLGLMLGGMMARVVDCGTIASDEEAAVGSNLSVEGNVLLTRSGKLTV